MKYQVVIPKPKAKRLKHGKLLVSMNSGWEVDPTKTYEIHLNQTSFEFEVGDDFEYVHNTSWIDGSTFDVVVEFTNDNESRKETYRLVPTKV